MTEHNPNFPWRQDGNSNTILDCTGMPVAMGLNYTSVNSGKSNESGVIYNTSEYAGPIRTKMIVEAINRMANHK